MRKQKSDYIIQTVDHALDILDQFKDNSNELGVTDLSKRLNIHKNKVFRILATLNYRNYIEQNYYNENYRLGLKALELGQSYVNKIAFLPKAKPVQESLARKCCETTYISIMNDFKTVYLTMVESTLPVRAVPRIGAVLPFHCTETGKIFASSISEDIVRELFDKVELEKNTANTIIEVEDLINELRTIADHGYAIDNEELEIGVKSVGAPFRDYTMKIVGVVSISGPSTRMGTARINDELVPLVKEAAREISMRLGYF